MLRDNKIKSTKNFLKKVLVFLCIITFSKSWGQATIPVSRTAWGTTPTGWTDGQGGSPTYGSDICSGSDATSGRLDNTGEYFIVNYNTGASALSFCMQGNGFSGGTFSVEESVNGSTWTNVQSYTTISATASTRNLTLSCASRYVRFIYTTKSSGNVQLDNVSITQGVCSACTPPTTTISATSQTLCTSTATSFSVGTSATVPTYVWQMSSNNSTWVSVANGTPAGAAYNGTNTATLSYTTGSSSITYYYRCQVTENGTCTATSNVNTVTINAPVSITSGATDKGLCSGGNTTMDITGAAATKQWYVSTDNGVTFNVVTLSSVYTAGITTNNLSITNPPVSYNGYQYYCTVSVSGCPTLTSSIGVLTVTQTPSAPPTPTALANPACSGTSLAAMTSTVAGVTWYWQGTNAAGTSTTNPTSLQYNLSSSGTYYVRARTDGSSCLSTSSSTAITVNSPPTIATNPVDKTQCVGTNTTFSVSASGTSLTYQWQYNTGSGFVNVPNSAPYSNVTSATMSITNIIAGMNGYQYQCIVSGATPCSPVTSTVATLIITASGSPTLASSSPITNAIACNAFNLSWTNGSGSNRLVVVSLSPIIGSPTNGTSYTASNVYGSGSTISAGEFVVYKGSGNSVFITGLSASTTYYYKIFDFNGCSIDYLTSGIIPSGNITTTSCSSPLGATGVYINACGGGCGYEGNNELVWGTTGSYGLSVNSNGPKLDYTGVTQINSYGLNSSAITALNAAVTSCTNTVFVDPNTLGYIPANSKFLIANSCMCIPSAYDLSGFCNSGPIYVVFGTGPSWPCNTTGGIFGNSTSGAVKDFNIDFSAWGVSTNPSYSFTPSSLSSTDGAAITLNPSGGAATGYFNTGCAIPLTILPIDLIDFYATQDEMKNIIIWKVASEKSVLQYIVEKSEDGINYKELTRINSVVNEGENISYSCEDNYPNNAITYYKLSTIEKNQKRNYYEIIDIDRSNKNWETIIYQNNNDLVLEFKKNVPKNAVINLFDLSGKLIADETIKDFQTKINIKTISSGIYFARITTPYKSENFKIIILND